MTEQRKQKIKKFVDNLYKVYKVDGVCQFLNLVDSMIKDIENKKEKSRLDPHRIEFLNDVRSILTAKGIVALL